MYTHAHIETYASTYMHTYIHTVCKKVFDLCRIAWISVEIGRS